MSVKATFELARIVHDDDSSSDVGPLEITERHAVVTKGKTGHQLYIVRSDRMAHDDLVTGQMMHDEFYAKNWKHILEAMILQKQGVFVGTVQVLQPCTVRAAVDHPVAVRIKTIEPLPLKDLEDALANPFVGTDWSSYAIDLSDEDILPRQMKVLILKWRPTKKRTRQAIKFTADLLLKVGLAFGLAEAHNQFAGDGLVGGNAAQGPDMTA